MDRFQRWMGGGPAHPDTELQLAPRRYRVVFLPESSIRPAHPDYAGGVDFWAASYFWQVEHQVCGLVGVDGRGVAVFRMGQVAGIFEVQG